LTDTQIPRRLGPKRASKIRKLFNLSKTDNVKAYVIARKFENKKGKTVIKKPKIQRLVTPVTLKRKETRNAEKVKKLQKSRQDAAEYSALVAKRLAEQNEARRSQLSKRRSSRKTSKKD
jgi:small subunit ribosomal protein S6e